MIYIRYKKHPSRMINSSYVLRDADRLSDELKTYLIGDAVSVMFPISEERARVINAAEIEGLSVNPRGAIQKQLHVHIPFKVVARRHAAIWKDTGNLQDIGLTVTLEAETGHWEDVFLWVACGERPSWVELET